MSNNLSKVIGNPKFKQKNIQFQISQSIHYAILFNYNSKEQCKKKKKKRKAGKRKRRKEGKKDGGRREGKRENST